MDDEFIIDLNKINPYTKGSGPIIVVDDDESQIMLVKTCYKKSKRENELICMLSGEEFLDFSNKVRSGDKEMPELVLLDINMPKINGFDVLNEIRNSNVFKNVPVIVMFTSSDADNDKEKAKKLHANAFFSKPSNVSDYVKFFQSI